MVLEVQSLLVAVAVATTCCAIARIILYKLHPGMDGLGHWAWASVVGALSFAVAGTGAGMSGDTSLSVAHGLVILGFCLVWDGFRRFLGRKPFAPRVYVGLGGVALALILYSHLQGSLHVRAAANSLAICAISAGVARELLWRAPPKQLAMRLAGWVYFLNAAFFALRGVSVGLDLEFMGGRLSYGITALATLWWLCVTISVTLCMVLMAGERLQEELNHQASRDPLTGALNRRAFSGLAEKELARARRSGLPLSVLMMDLDHFKQVNDRLGHGGGDDALCLFVALAGRLLRTEDLFCRFGGEEFLALLPGSTAVQSLVVAERLRTIFTEEAGQDVPGAASLPFAMTVSVGIAQLAEDDGLEEIIRRADAALYRAKDLGRNRCELAGG
ncbi:GAF domain/sensory box/EAL domain protein [Paramagnetospirillum magnetotacticum MS-1]|uniref:diguanylate cyclase n=1 Tax=Paramagnetospirillum magnetotacticum MS-1 TaxID=272627 RepID=A0A0C2YW69_PARME|nr:GGDEF domain-containing protein [Paramagnetospirillum magnetotacticum]KIL98945.1 GAF domain/sensory box/EAL domain protein [Paramagnetospirillum magnetotacticum MS-1]